MLFPGQNNLSFTEFPDVEDFIPPSRSILRLAPQNICLLNNFSVAQLVPNDARGFPDYLGDALELSWT